MPNYTLVLDHLTAERIQTLSTLYGASVGGFAAAHVKDLAELDPETLARVREYVHRTACEARRAREREERPKR